MISMALNKPAEAVREFFVLLALAPTDRAEAHCLLAEAYLQAGQRQKAKLQALAALEIAPSYEKAQEILLQAIE